MLQELKPLLDTGVITEDEFAAKVELLACLYTWSSGLIVAAGAVSCGQTIKGFLLSAHRLGYLTSQNAETPQQPQPPATCRTRRTAPVRYCHKRFTYTCKGSVFAVRCNQRTLEYASVW
eukprot:4139208-Prymnesium_polylepis.1